MIVRIATEGQYELGDGDMPALNELDDAAHVACHDADEHAFHESFTRLLEYVRAHGKPVDEDHLGGSDLILPPPDISLDEAKTDYDFDELIPEG
jgi:hypothetical protein